MDPLTAKRMRNEELRQRFLNTRLRKLGACPQHWNTLQQEQTQARQRAAEEKAADKVHAEELDEVLEAVEFAQQQERREMEIAARDFSREHLAKEQRREYELSDPNAWKRDDWWPYPGQPHCGPAALTTLKGEELSNTLQADTKAKQKTQKQWLDEQLEQQRARRAQERHEEATWAGISDATVLARQAVEDEQARVARELKEAEVAANAELAQLRRSMKQQQREEDAHWRQHHVATMRSSRLLTEEPLRHSNRRPIRSEFKGASVEELQARLDTLEEQRRLNAEQRQAAAEEEQMYAEQNTEVAKIKEAVEFETKRARQEMERQLREENERIAAAWQETKRALDQLKRGAIHDDFYDLRFCTSHR